MSDEAISSLFLLDALNLLRLSRCSREQIRGGLDELSKICVRPIGANRYNSAPEADPPRLGRLKNMNTPENITAENEPKQGAQHGRRIRSKIVAAPPAKPENPDVKYAKQVAIAFGVVHIIFAIFISVWYFHRYILNPIGFGYIIYILEFPGAIVVSLLGMAKDAESATPYIIAFVINTAFYGLIGYLLGILFHKKKWNEEVSRLFKLEPEAYEDVAAPKPDIPEAGKTL